jgi:hypothetical protein
MHNKRCVSCGHLLSQYTLGRAANTSRASGVQRYSTGAAAAVATASEPPLRHALNSVSLHEYNINYSRFLL